MSRLKRALATLVVVAGGVMALQNISSASVSQNVTGHTKSFRITRLALPKEMIENGPSKNMSIYWDGNPTFPVTLYIAEPTCAENVQCNSGHLLVSHRADPIVWHDLWKCTGNVSSTMFSYSFWMVDAKGVKTQKVPADVLCTE
jgi:hypothetical protein